jgi:hypothetical protein
MTDRADVASAFVSAVTGRDFARQEQLLAAEVRFRGLTPNGLRTADTAGGAVGWLRRWFGDADRAETLARSAEPVADRYRMSWRLRVREDGQWYEVEQSAYCTVGAGRITELDLVCSGFRAMPTGTD